MPRPFTAIVLSAGALALACGIRTAPLLALQAKPGASSSGWTIPPDAQAVKSPLAVDEKVIAAGKAIFKDKCERCHGPAGRGDGPDAEPDTGEMDLTLAKRAERNPDGVVFHKVLNGRRKPKMPAFKEELSQEQIWTVVAYVQSLRDAQ
ncbi:MAG TPA: c-type cytochrome [Vicinamibacterales bacterium]|jgi:mono/diheme cytochrome c family protein|nr:c-type cytochrome [Vicinamibacterales bacterium]